MTTGGTPLPRRERYRQRIEDGLCAACGSPNDTDNVKCARCATARAQSKLITEKIGRAVIRKEEETIQGLLMEERERAMEAAAKMDMAKAVRERTTVDLIRDALIASTSYLDFSDTPWPRIPRSGPGKPETQVLLLSDIQYGRVTKSFNTNIARDRLRFLVEKTMRIADLHREAYPMEDLEVFMLGDMIDNEILFPTQPHQVEMSVFHQIKNLSRLLAEALTTLAGNYNNIHVTCVPGNHGRVTRFNDPVSNWDNITYMTLESLLQTHPRITFDIPDSLYDWYKVRNVRGYGFLLVHGDQFRTWLNYPWYGANRKAMQWLSSIEESWSYMIHGHFHTQMMGLDINDQAEIMANGTFLSGDEYSLRVIGAKGSIKQMTFGVNEHYGISWRYGLQLDP